MRFSVAPMALIEAERRTGGQKWGAMKRFVRVFLGGGETEQVVPPTHMNRGPSTTIAITVATFNDATEFTCNECVQR